MSIGAEQIATIALPFCVHWKIWRGEFLWFSAFIKRNSTIDMMWFTQLCSQQPYAHQARSIRLSWMYRKREKWKRSENDRDGEWVKQKRNRVKRTHIFIMNIKTKQSVNHFKRILIIFWDFEFWTGDTMAQWARALFYTHTHIGTGTDIDTDIHALTDPMPQRHTAHTEEMGK